MIVEKKSIPYGRQEILKEDIDAVISVLESDFLTQGPAIAEFENAFAKYVGAKYAIAVSNGTAALHLAMESIGVKKNDLVVSSPITFAASTNAALYVGAKIDFCDISPHNYLLDLNKLEEKCDKGEKIQAVVAVDFAGYPIDSKRLKNLANKYNFKIIEDACHAPGAIINYEGEQIKTGSCQYADVTVFSFHPVKHIACGEGGMITTNDEEVFKKCSLLRTHGIIKTDEMIQNHGGWYYEMQELGYNYRLTDMQAALGLSQIKRIESNLRRRREIANIYDDELKHLSEVQTPIVEKNISHAYHLYVLQVTRRKEFYNYLRENNIFSQVLYIPVHLLPFYKKLGFKEGDYPLAESYYEKALAIPMYHSLTESDQAFVIETIRKFCEA